LWTEYDEYKTIEDVAEAIKVPYEEVKKWSLLSRRLSPKIRDAQRSESTVLTNAHTRELMKYFHSVQDKLADVIIRKKISSHGYHLETLRKSTHRNILIRRLTLSDYLSFCKYFLTIIHRF